MEFIDEDGLMSLMVHYVQRVLHGLLPGEVELDAAAFALSQAGAHHESLLN